MIINKTKNKRMEVVIIILAYVANVFLNRWLNKILLHKKKGMYHMIPAHWFLSYVTTFFFVVSIIEDSKFFKWFTGKYW